MVVILQQLAISKSGRHRLSFSTDYLQVRLNCLNDQILPIAQLLIANCFR